MTFPELTLPLSDTLKTSICLELRIFLKGVGRMNMLEISTIDYQRVCNDCTVVWKAIGCTVVRVLVPTCEL